MNVLAEDKGIAFLSVIPVRGEASDRSEMVTQLLFGESYSIIGIEEKWLRIRLDFDAYEGYIDRKQYMELDEETASEYASEDVVSITADFKTEIEDFGTIHLSPGSIVPEAWMKGHERFTRHINKVHNPEQLIRDAKKFLGTPYMWGGRSIFGIDCSGLMQVVFKLNGRHLPRDASQQIDCGRKVAFEDHKMADLAFFQNEKGRIIHVGLIMEPGIILHASGWVKQNEFTQKGILDENGQISHHFHSIKRIFEG